MQDLRGMVSNVRSSVIVAGLVLSAVATPSAYADWIVTNDGASFEIKGGWEVKGSVATFLLPNGTYSSVRLSDVDLDASEALTKKVAEEAMKKDEPQLKRRAEVVITDADVSHPSPELEPLVIDPDEATDEEATTATAVAPRVELEVTDWQERVDIPTTSLEITGQVRNPGSNPVTNITLSVLLYDDDRALLSERSARVDQSFLSPGASTRFVASFPDVMSFDSVEFSTRSRGFVNHPGSGEGGIYRGDG